MQDEFAGQGGSYVVENGKRRLVERTAPPGQENQPEAPAPAAAETAPAAPARKKKE